MVNNGSPTHFVLKSFSCYLNKLSWSYICNEMEIEIDNAENMRGWIGNQEILRYCQKD